MILEHSLRTAYTLALTLTSLLVEPLLLAALEGLPAHASTSGVIVPLKGRVYAARAGTDTFTLAGLAVVESQRFAIALVAATGVLPDADPNTDVAAAGHPNVDADGVASALKTAAVRVLTAEIAVDRGEGDCSPTRSHYLSI